MTDSSTKIEQDKSKKTADAKEKTQRSHSKEKDSASQHRSRSIALTIGLGVGAIVHSIAPASGAEFALLPPSNATENFTKIVQRVPVKILFDPQSIKGYERAIVPGMSVEVEVVLEKQEVTSSN